MPPIRIQRMTGGLGNGDWRGTHVHEKRQGVLIESSKDDPLSWIRRQKVVGKVFDQWLDAIGYHLA
jgi:hypothetical protein